MSNRVSPLPAKPDNAQGTLKPTDLSHNEKTQRNPKPVEVNGKGHGHVESSTTATLSNLQPQKMWELNRYRIHSIFLVCVLSALTIFSVLIYDIVVDGIKVGCVTSDGRCLQRAFRMVDVYFDLLRIYDVIVHQNSTACNNTDVTVSEMPSITEISIMCDEYSAVFHSQCEAVLSDLFDQTSWTDLSSRTQPFLEMLFKLRDELLDCFTATGLLPWTYPSVIQTLLTLLWETYERAVVCCYRSSSSSASSQSLPSFSSAYEFIRNSTIDKTVSYLMYVASVSSLRNILYPELWNITDLLMESKIHSDCGTSSSISEMYQTYQSVFSFVKFCMGALESSVEEENSDNLSYITRRVVFNCCAVLVGTAMAAAVSFRVKVMADWLGR